VDRQAVGTHATDVAVPAKTAGTRESGDELTRWCSETALQREDGVEREGAMGTAWGGRRAVVFGMERGTVAGGSGNCTVKDKVLRIKPWYTAKKSHLLRQATAAKDNGKEGNVFDKLA